MLATKLYGDMGDWPNEGRLSALNIRRACDASLRRLQTDYIDLYQMHHIDRGTGWDEIWEAMEVLRAQGKILYVGSSNFAGWHIAKAQEAAARRNFMGLVSEQSIYNLFVRDVEPEVLPAAEAYGLGVIPWSPLQGGLLGGVVRKERDGSRRYAGRAAETIEARRPQLEAYEDLCAEVGRGAGHGRAGLAADPARGDRPHRRPPDARAPRLGAAGGGGHAGRQGAGASRRDLPGPQDGPGGLRLVSGAPGGASAGRRCAGRDSRPGGSAGSGGWPRSRSPRRGPRPDGLAHGRPEAVLHRPPGTSGSERSPRRACTRTKRMSPQPRVPHWIDRDHQSQLLGRRRPVIARWTFAVSSQLAHPGLVGR